ncbi:MAG TPA: WG repeat-containing protein, partial [Candidatus Ozemobacteraceae bacterium]|nr:WG repeat-containing protein [Candidatus Ozemobacteraceae bacterium]
VPEWGGKCYEDDVFEVFVLKRDGTTLKLPEAKEISLPAEGIVILDRVDCHDTRTGSSVFSSRRSARPYKFVTTFHEGMALVSDSGQTRFGFVQRQNFELTIPLEFHEGRDFHDGVALVRREEQWGIVDQTGMFRALPADAGRMSNLPQADILKHRSENSFTACPARDFREGVAAVTSRRGQWGFVDTTGQWVIPPQFDWAGSFSEGLAAVRVGLQYRYIDRSGKTIIPGPFSCARRFSHGLAPVRLKDVFWGLIDTRGTCIVQPAWASVESCSDGVVPFTVLNGARSCNRAGIYDVETREARVFDHLNFIKTFSEGIAVARRGKYGFIDINGNPVACDELSRRTPNDALRWSEASSFRDGLALVESRHL